MLFEGHVVIEERRDVRKITRTNFNGGNTPVLEDDYSVLVDGSKIGNFLTHFWRSTGFWYVYISYENSM